MIIKVSGVGPDESWRFYEAHEVQWAKCTYQEALDETVDAEESGICICEVFQSSTVMDGTSYARICFYDQNNEARQVYTAMTAYLLNNEGKTIDRIN